MADAAYVGYELARAILRYKQSFLLRLSSKIYLYTAEHAFRNLRTADSPCSQAVAPDLPLTAAA